MKELGEHLKSERLQRGLTLKTISQRARISVSVLQSLEDGEQDRFGTALLIRNFVRGYCSVLGIDPAPLLEKYAAEILATDRQDEGIRRHRVLVKNLRRKRRLGTFPMLLMAIAVIGVFYGGMWAWKRHERLSVSENMQTDVYPQEEFPPDLSNKSPSSRESETGKNAPAKAEADKRPPSEAGASEVEKPEPLPAAAGTEGAHSANPMATANNPTEVLPEEKPPSPTPKVQKHLFTAEADQKTWVQVTTDGKKTHDALLQPGEKREWEAEEGMDIVVGNAGGIRMKWDGQSVFVPTKPGGVLRFKLPDPKYIGQKRRNLGTGAQ